MINPIYEYIVYMYALWHNKSLSLKLPLAVLFIQKTILNLPKDHKTYLLLTKTLMNYSQF